MKEKLITFWYSFPIQLVLLHLKENKLLLLFWALLYLFITNNLARKFGIPYLLLDPEYLGRVNFWSFFCVGTTFGFMAITWHIVSYMLHSYRFPFLGTLRSPLYHFCINNSLIPIVFTVAYCIRIHRFQTTNEFKEFNFVSLYILGFLLGTALVVLLLALYFYLTNKNITDIVKAIKAVEKKRRFTMPPNQHKIEVNTDTQAWEGDLYDTSWRVDSFIGKRFKARRTRKVEHYSNYSLRLLFQQHHTNTLVLLLIALVILVVLGLLIEYPFFQLPAAASMLLIFTVLIGLIGALNYWMQAWRNLGFIVILLFFNFFTRYDWINYDTKAYGLNYDMPKTNYDLEHIYACSSEQTIAADRATTLDVLNNWHRKQTFSTNTRTSASTKKPDLILLNFSGGGLRAATWGMQVVQTLDSILQGQLLDKTFLMTGASGGMMAATYLRELHYRKVVEKQAIKLYDEKYLHKLAADYLNPIVFSIAVNDLFYPFQTFDIGGHTYRKNRASMFEQQFHKNTDSLMLGKTIGHYKVAEQQALVPMVVYTPTISNDNRKLLIATQSVSYLSRPFSSYEFKHPQLTVDGIDLHCFFDKQNANNLLVSSAMRMSATFPYILPGTHMPSSPTFEVVDAGFRDNFGAETSYRFAYSFHDWIKQNIDEVVVIFIRDTQKVMPITDYIESFFEKLVKPISIFMTNEMQDFYSDHTAAVLDEILDGKLNIVTFEYQPSDLLSEASVSFHLTTREKNDILKAINTPMNQQAIQQLLQLLSN